MSPALRYPSVTVLTERPASNGRSVQGQSGPGIIMPDEPENIYISSPPGSEMEWYGRWPLSETSIPEPNKQKALRTVNVWTEPLTFDSPQFRDALVVLYEEIKNGK